MSAKSIIDGLTVVVQYRHKHGTKWTTMAAFEKRTVAEYYCESRNPGEVDWPWEYRVVDIPSATLRDAVSMGTLP